MSGIRIGIVGHFGGREEFTDGQTVKTFALYDALSNIDSFELLTADVYYIKRNPIRFIASFLKLLLCSDKIIVLLSHRGRKTLFPILKAVASHKEVYHYAIGGRIAKEVTENRRQKACMSGFKGNWVESRKEEDTLRGLGLMNVRYVPNFKHITALQQADASCLQDMPRRFCFFSRVTREKGVEDAIRAIRRVNEDADRTVAVLDIYGPVEPDYEERLEYMISHVGGGYSHYIGVVPVNKSVEVLRSYYALLFPTFWPGEGMPGTIIDAMSAGLPVIARRWEYCDEMITDGVNGYVYDFDRPELVKDKIMYSIEHPEEMISMRKNCLTEAQKYSAEAVLSKILDEMGLKA